MSKQVTIVNQVAGPMCIDIANAFVDKGYDTRLITGMLEPTYSAIDPKVKIIYGIKYRRHKPFLRIITWIIFFVQCFFWLLFSNKDRRLLLVSNPPIAPFLGMFFNKFFNQQFDVLIYDIYPDILTEMKMIKKQGIIHNVWKYLNRKTFSRALRVITISDGMKEVLSNYCNLEKIEVIPCWVDSSKIKPIIPKSENWFARKYDQVDKTTVLYSGNMGQSHDLEVIIESARQLSSHNDIHFLLIGDGVKKNELVRMVEKNDLKNVTILPFQDADVVPYSMACGDIAIVATEKEASSFLVPSKTFYYIASGSKIVSLSKLGSELDCIVKKHHLGFNIYPEESSKDIASKIEFLSQEVTDIQKVENSQLAKKYNIDHAYKF